MVNLDNFIPQDLSHWGTLGRPRARGASAGAGTARVLALERRPCWQTPTGSPFRGKKKRDALQPWTVPGCLFLRPFYFYKIHLPSIQTQPTSSSALLLQVSKNRFKWSSYWIEIESRSRTILEILAIAPKLLSLIISLLIYFIHFVYLQSIFHLLFGLFFTISMSCVAHHHVQKNNDHRHHILPWGNRGLQERDCTDLSFILFFALFFIAPLIIHSYLFFPSPL